MSQPFRLSAGGAIDRSRPIGFRFGGRAYRGYHGDTLASALLANGVRLVGRSFKYHRPRGVIGAGVEECNALVQLGEGARSTPNVPATTVPLHEGLVAAPVNCWPSARFDLGAVNGLVSRFLPAGFYYKSLMWPSWSFYEGMIRRAAGLGKAARQPDPDRYEHRHAHCDVLIVGAGSAGLAAARAAAAGGARVMLVEQEPALGSSLRVDGGEIDGIAAAAWIDGVAGDLARAEEAICLTRTTAVGYFDHNLVTLLETVGDQGDPALPRTRLWEVRAKRVVLATGAIERPLVFPGNDRPGIMLAEAVRRYIAQYGVRPGKRIAVLTDNDEAYRTAFACADAGLPPVAVIDTRASVRADLARDLVTRGIPHHLGFAVTATRGRKALRAIRVGNGTDAGLWLACDCLAMSGGHNPTTHLFAQSGGTLRFDEETACFVPDRSAQAECSVGAASGRFGLAAALATGHAAGTRFAAETGWPSAALPPSTVEGPAATPVGAGWHIEGSGKAFVDFQNDVTVDDIALAARENFRSVEHLKRYTTLGMGTDQGKTANVNALALMAARTGATIAETGTTRFRFPFTPMPLAAFAGPRRGPLFRPLRHMPGHDRHVVAGAAFEDMGGWLRPSGYPAPGESAVAAEQREARAVRAAAGLFEGSPLGKIEIVGPDAATFLDRLYCNRMSTLGPGRVRYGLMLDELGVIIDDGVCARLAEDRFLVCTTSGGAARIAAWIEEWHQCEWPDLDLVAVPVTGAWGVLTLSGPNARAILSRAGTDIDLDPVAFPHMSVREGLVAGLAARVLRVSYTGDLSFEVNVATAAIPALWDALTAAGASAGLVPVGIDAWMTLRIEKGYLHVGADTDGTTIPADVGFGHVLRRRDDFIGKRSLNLAENRRDDRLELVGVEGLAGEPPLTVGAQILGDDGAGSDGYLTSVCHSPSLGRIVALAMARGGSRRLGEAVLVATAAGRARARIVATAAFDPEGARLHA